MREFSSGANRFPRWVAAVGLCLVTVAAQGATYYWDDGTVSVNTASGGGSGIWCVGSNGWENGATAVTWANANDAVFAGTAGMITNSGAITAGSITFNAAGYTVYNNTSDTLTATTLAGSSAFTKVGAGTLVLSGASGYSGAMTVGDGILQMNNGATLSSGTGLTLSGGMGTVGGSGYPFKGLTRGGTLYLRDDSGSPGGNQIGSQTLSLNNGTVLWYSGGGSDITTLSTVSLAGGHNSIGVAPNANPDVLKITNLNRTAGATAEFRAAYATLGTGEAQIRPANVNGSAIANVNGILGGWAFVANTSGAECAEPARYFATWNASATIGSEVGSIVAATPDKQTSANALSGGTSTENWLGNGNNANSTITADTTINSLIEQSDVIINSGATLTLSSGGLILRNNNFWMQSSSGAGYLTSGGNDLYLQADGATGDQAIKVYIKDGGAGAVTLRKSGSGLVKLTQQNTYTGGTFINQGTLDLQYGGQQGCIRGAVTVNGGGVLQLTSGDATGWGGNSSGLTTINLSGGNLNVGAAVNETLGTNAVVNMTGGSITGNSSGSLDFLGPSAALNTLASPVTSTISSILLFPLRQGSMTFTVADGQAAVDLDVSSILRPSPSGDGAGAVFTKAGSGYMRLSSTNSFDRCFTISGGTVEITSTTTVGSGSGLGSGSANNGISVGSGASLLFTTGSRSCGYHAAAVTNNGGTITFNTSDNSLASGKEIRFDTAAGTINGSGQLRRRDSGNQVVVTAAASGSTITVADLNLLDSTPTFDVADGSASVDLMVSSGISGSSLTKLGAGVMALSGANSYGSGTTVSAGTLQVNGTGSLPGSASVGASGTLRLNADGVTWANTVTGSGTVQLMMSSDAAGNTQMSGLGGFTGTIRLSNDGNTGSKWNATAGVTASGATVLIDSGSQMYVGGTCTFAAIQVQGTGNNETRGAIRLGGTLAGPVSLLGSATIGTEGGLVSGNITSGASGTQTLTLGTANSTGAGTFSGIIGGGTGTLALTVAAGTSTLSGANTYSGTTALNGGTLAVTGSSTGGGDYNFGGGSLSVSGTVRGNAFSLGSTSSGITINSGGVVHAASLFASWSPATFTVNGTLNISGALTASWGATKAIDGTGTINAGSFSDRNYSTVNCGVGTLTVTNSFMTGDNDQDSYFNQTGGTVNLNTSNSSDIRIAHWSRTGTYNMTGGTLNVPNTVFNNGWDGTATFTINNVSAVANLKGLAMGASGHGGGANTLTLTSGRLNIGTLGIVQNGGGTKTVSLGAGTVGAFGGDWSSSVNMTLANAATGVTFDTLDSANGTTPRQITLSGALSSSGKLVKAGAGTLTLSGNNSFTGDLNVNSGRVTTAIQANGAGTTSGVGNVAVARSLVANNGGTLAFTINNAMNNGTIPTATLVANAGGLITASRFNAVGPVTLNGGTLENTVPGGTDVNWDGWYLQGTVTVGGSSASTISSTTSRLNRLASSTTFNVADATSSSAADLVVSAPFGDIPNGGGSAALVKSGAGLMLLTADSTYTGTTTINASGGTLQVGNGGASGQIGNNAGAVTVNAGGTLKYYRSDNGLSLGNAITGSGDVIFQGTGVSLQSSYSPTANNSSFTGNIYVNGARLSIDSANDVGGTIYVNAAGGLYVYGGITVARPLYIGGNGWLEGSQLGALRLDSSPTWSGNVTLTNDARVCGWNGASGNITGNVLESGGSRRLEVYNGTGGAGTITLTGVNSYSGGTTVNGPIILRVSGDGALGTVPGALDADNIILQSGGRLQGGNTGAGANVTLDANRGISLPSGSGYLHAWTGFTLTANGPVSGAGSLYKSDGGTAVLNGTVNIGGLVNADAGGIQFNQGLTCGGELQLSSGVAATIGGTGGAIAGGIKMYVSTLNLSHSGTLGVGDLEVGNSGSQAGTVNHTSGALVVTNDLRIGHYPSETSVYNISGGSITQPDTVSSPTDEGQANLFIGIDGTGNLNISGTAVVRTSSLVVDGRGGGSADTLNLTGGELNIGRWGIRTPGTAIVNLGGGVLGAWSADWSSSVAMTLTGTGGNVTIDTLDAVNGVTPRTITLTGVLSGSGGLIKGGDGMLLLNAANTYRGTTTVDGGTLWGTGSASNSTLTVNAGGTLGPTNSATLGTFTVGNASFSDGAHISCLVNGSTPTVNVLTNLTTAGTNWIDLVLASPLSAGTYTLLNYTNMAGTGVFQLTRTFGRQSVTLSTNVAQTTIDLVVSAPIPTNLVWQGTVSGAWDVDATTNWLTTPGGAQYTFAAGDTVTFDDTAASTTVSVSEVVGPALTVANNASKSITLGGYAIGGSGGLNKVGAGTLTLNNANTYTGVTAISNGVLVVSSLANGGSASPIGAASTAAANLVLNGGTLRYTGGSTTINRMFTIGSAGGVMDVTNAASTLAFSGGGWYTTGTLTKRGAGKLSFQSYSGSHSGASLDMIVEEGELRFDTGYDWVGWPTDAMRILVTNGASLYTAYGAFGGYAWGNEGALEQVTVEQGSTWTIGGSFRHYIQGGTYGSEGRIVLHGGSITGSSWIHPESGLQMDSRASAVTSTCSAPYSPYVSTGWLTLNVEDGVAATDLRFSGVISHLSTLTKNGAGTAELTGVNTFTGNTTINAGTLAVAGAGRLYSPGWPAAVTTVNSSGTLQLENWNVGMMSDYAYGNLVLNGGTVKYVGSESSSPSDVDGTYGRAFTIGASGGTLESAAPAGYTWPITQYNAANAYPLANLSGTLTLAGTGNGYFSKQIPGGTGGLTKAGSGTWTLAGTNLYTGATSINAGVLKLTASGSVSNSVSILVGSNTVFNVLSVAAYSIAPNQLLQGGGTVTGAVAGAASSKLAPGTIGTAGTLTIGGSYSPNSLTTNCFDLGTDTGVGGGTNDLLVVNGNVNLGDSRVVINELSSLSGETNYVLMSYTGTRTGTNILVTTGTGRKGYSLVYDDGNKLVKLAVTGVSLPLVWNPEVSTNWDQSASNWTNSPTGPQGAFYNGDFVLFTDLGAVSNNVAITATNLPGSVVVNSASNYTFSGSGKISGYTGLTKAGAGTLTVATTNDFTGSVIVTGGVFKVAYNGALGLSTGITAAAGGAVDINGTNQSDKAYNYTLGGSGPDGLGALRNTGAARIGNETGVRNVTLTADATVGSIGNYNVNDAGRIDLGTSGGTISGAGRKLTVTGGGVVPIRSTTTTLSELIVTNVCVYSEDVDNNLGSLVRVQQGGTLAAYNGRTQNGAVVLEGGSLGAMSSAACTWSGSIAVNAASSIKTYSVGGYSSGDIYLTGALSGSGNLAVTNGGNSVVLTGNNSGYSGKFDVTGTSSGFFRISSDAALGTASGADVITLRGTRLQGGTSGAGANVTLGATRGITIPSGQSGYLHPWGGYTLTHNGTISGGGTLYKTDTGTLVLGGACSHTGTTALDAGTLTLSGNGAITQTGTFRNGGGGVTLNVQDNASINALNYMIFGDYTGCTITINQTGGGVTNNGTVNNPGGNDVANRWGHWGSAAATYNLSGGTLSLLGAPLYLSWDSGATLNISGTGVANLKGVDMGYGGHANAATINLNAGGTLNVGSSGLYTGNTTSKNINLNGGTLGTLASWSSSRPMTLSGTATTIRADSGYTMTLAGVLSGTGAGFTKTGGGTLTLQTVNSFTGPLMVNSGLVNFANADYTQTVPAGNTVTVNGGTLDLLGINVANGVHFVVNTNGTLRFSAYHEHVQNLTMAGGTLASSGSGKYAGQDVIMDGDMTVTGAVPSTISVSNGFALNGSRTISVADVTGNSDSDLLVNGPVVDGGIIKAGAGTMLVSVAPTYTGTTVISGGVLRLNAVHNAAGNYTVGGTGTLSGSGTINTGSVTVQSAGKVDSGAAAAAVGTLNVAAFTMQSGSTLHVDISGATADKVVATGAVSLTGTVEATDLGGSNAGGEWVIVHASAPVTCNLTPPGGYTILIGNGGLDVILHRIAPQTFFMFK